MSRRRRDDAQVSLFPFLSVLACIMGALTLMIGASALGQMDLAAEPASAKPTDNSAPLKRELELIASEMRVLEARKQVADQIHVQLNLAVNELSKLQAQWAEQKKQVQTNAELKAQLERQLAELKTRITQLESNLKQRTAKIQELEGELARRTAPPPEATVQVRPSGSGRDLDPTFIECRADGIVLYNHADPRDVPVAELRTNAGFLEMLQGLSQDPKATVIFLVRSDGISTYFVARDVARSKNCRNGKLPIVGQGEIDLSLVNKGPHVTEPEPAQP